MGHTAKTERIREIGVLEFCKSYIALLDAVTIVPTRGLFMLYNTRSGVAYPALSPETAMVMCQTNRELVRDISEFANRSIVGNIVDLIELLLHSIRCAIRNRASGDRTNYVLSSAIINSLQNYVSERRAHLLDIVTITLLPPAPTTVSAYQSDNALIAFIDEVRRRCVDNDRFYEYDYREDPLLHLKILFNLFCTLSGQETGEASIRGHIKCPDTVKLQDVTIAAMPFTTILLQACQDEINRTSNAGVEYLYCLEQLTYNQSSTLKE